MLRTRLALSSLGVVAVALGTIGAALPAEAATTTTAATTASTCSAAPWETTVQGAPAGYKAGSATGDTIYHDSHGFHLRATHPGTSRKVFTGVITSNAPMAVTRYHLEKDDVLKLSSDHKTLVFSFVNHGAIDGANIVTDCATTLTVSKLHNGNANLPASEVYLGSAKTNPAAVPFTITRQAASTTN